MKYTWKHTICSLIATGVFFGITILAASRLTSAKDISSVRRFAFVVGANDGGAERPKLRFADSDATSFANVMQAFGGVRNGDLLLITDAGRETLLDGFSRITHMLNTARRSGEKTELVFYYSGHSNENGMLLKDDIFTYREMKHQIDTLPARVRIAILDSCASGALVRLKGGRRTTPFLVDASREVNGVALLTSASADEVAQESERIGGSYFTHFLVSGIRGAADFDRDGRVTLNESYAYAFNETLHRTADSQGGAQHPNYDFRLAGAGDYVLTDLRDTNALILFAPEVTGRIFIRDSKGHLVAEINKRSDRPIRIGVAPGSYEVTIAAEGTLRRGAIRIAANRPGRINADSLRIISQKETTVRGDAKPKEEKEAPAKRWFPVAIGFLPGVSTNGRTPTRNNLALNIIGKGHSVRGLELGVVVSIRTHQVNGFQGTWFYNHAGSLHGVQFAFVNMSVHQMRGYQWGIVNISHVSRGLQTAFVNVNRDAFSGFQLGGVNATIDMLGLQTGFVNVQKGDMKGLQLGLFNSSASIGGFQFGLVNANEFVFKGVQLGLVNSSGTTKGLQLGLVNIAKGDFDGAQIGLFNYAANGIFAPATWVSDNGDLNIALKIGNRHTYGIFGNTPVIWGNRSAGAAIAGFGVHLEFHPAWSEIDTLYHWASSITEKDGYVIDDSLKTRWSMGYRLRNKISVFAGISLNYLMSEKRESIALGPGLSFYNTHNGSITRELSLGAFAGIQWEPQWSSHNTWRGRKYAQK